MTFILFQTLFAEICLYLEIDISKINNKKLTNNPNVKTKKTGRRGCIPTSTRCVLAKQAGFFAIHIERCLAIIPNSNIFKYLKASAHVIFD